MTIINAFPPNYDQIVEAIPEVANAQPIFAYGFDVYNPYLKELDAFIIYHEATHGAQQEAMGTPELWWQRYLADIEFRVAQEVEAYRNQLLHFKRIGPGKTLHNRRLYGRMLADQLASPMYGGVINRHRAYNLITGGI